MEKAKKDITKEIEAVENIIRILNQCLAINIKHKKIEAAKDTLKDIQICKEELNKLIEAKAINEKVLAKEKAKNVLQRSRTGFS